jgi:aminopeptidase N
MAVEYEGEVHGPKGGAGGQRVWDDIGPEGAYVRFESGWYPRIEGDAATADITLRLPDGWAAIANGRRISADNWTYHYRTDWPAAGLSFAAARYAVIGDQTGPVPVECFCFPQHEATARKLMEVCKGVLDAYGKLYGPYPFPTFAVAEIPHAYGGGHGDQGFIMLYEDAFAKPADEEFVAHEIAHNWWGGLLSCMESEFLIEGFASYSQALYREQTGGQTALQKAMREQAEAVLTASLGDSPVSCFEADSGPLLYEKGAWVLHMLRRLVGDDAWFRTVRSFVDANVGQVVTCREFQQAFEEASKQDLEWFFQQWLYGSDIPWVRGTLTPLPGGKARVTLTQHLVKGEPPAEAADPQPVWDTEPSSLGLLVEIAVQSDRGEVRKTADMRGPTVEIELDAPGAKDLTIDPDVWLLSYHRGLVGELDEDMQDLDRELQRELGDGSQVTPGRGETPQ